MKQTIDIKLPADLHFSSIIRNLAENFFQDAGFSEAWASRLKLVVDELFMNAVKYGSTLGTSVIRLRFTKGDGVIEFQVDDDGTGSQASTPEELQAKVTSNKADTSLTKTSGRGLAMITHLWTDSVSITKSELGGIAVLFSKKIETTPPPSPPPLQPTELMDTVTKVAPAPDSSPTKAVASPQGPVVTVSLSGEIDQNSIDSTTAAVEREIHKLPAGSTLALDFQKVAYINSVFIGLLAAWHTEVSEKGGAIQLKNLNEQIKDVLALVGLTKVLNVR